MLFEADFCIFTARKHIDGKLGAGAGAGAGPWRGARAGAPRTNKKVVGPA